MIRQTDFIDVGNGTSEATHKYQASQSGSVVSIEAYPEGEDFETLLKDDGRYHRKGEITFKVCVDPDNQGVRLRRRIDQSVPCQKAQVYIDGQYAGCWYYGYLNEFLRWFDSDFEIHPDFTRGRNSLDVKLVIESNEKTDRDVFTDFTYTVFCYDF